jgi:hypothetical protein
MRRNDKAQLAIFDALIFLAAASVVSASLLGAIAPSKPSDDAEIQGFVERAHSVFLRTTLQPDQLAGLGLDIDKNKTLTVFELIVSELVMAEKVNSPNRIDVVRSCLTTLLNGLLTPGLDYSWRAEHNSTILSVPSPTSPLDQPNGSTYVSKVASKMPLHDGDITMTLYTWLILE